MTKVGGNDPASTTGRRAVAIIAGQIVGGLEPGDPAVPPDMHPRAQSLGPVEGGEIDRNICRILGKLEADLAAAIRAEAAQRPGRGAIGLEPSLRHLEGANRKLRRGHRLI